MKKIMALLLTAAMTTALLAGCGSTASTTESTASTTTASTAAESTSSDASAEVAEDASIAGTTITAMVLQSQYIEQLQTMVEKFEDDYDITVDVTVVPDEQFLGMLEMRVANGEMPDIVQYNAPMIFNVIDAEEHLYNFTGDDWTTKLVSPEVTELDGQNYAFPLKATSGYHGIIYNAAVFAELGLEEPSTPEEFDQLCQDLLAAGKTPIYLASDMWVPQIFTSSGYARAFGEAENAELATEQLFSGEKQFSEIPELVEVLDDVLALRDAGYFNDDLSTLTWDEAWLELVSGEGGMIYGEGPMVGQYQEMYPDAEFGVFNYPASYDPDCTYLSGAVFSSSFVASKTSENIDAIKVMFNAFSTPEYLEIYFGGSNSGFPAFEGVDGGDMHPEVLELFEEHANNGTMVNEMNIHWAALESLFSDYLWAYYAEALNDPSMTGADVLDKFQGDFDKFLANS